MASAITLTVGAITATFVPAATDQKVANTLRDFYTAYRLGPENATDQQKLLACAKWFAKFAHSKAVQKYQEDQIPVNQTEAEAIYGVPEE